jgi:two-component system cell cycle sensor histidine kinase/response regulator CckA
MVTLHRPRQTRYTVLAVLLLVAVAIGMSAVKVDREESYGAVQESATGTSLLAGTVVLGALLSIWLLWNRKSAKFYRKQYQHEAEKLKVSKRYQDLLQYANDIILLADLAGNIVEVNDSAVSAYGYTRDELLSLDVKDLRAPEARPLLDAQLKQAMEHNGLVYESIHRRKDGSLFPIEASTRVVQLDGEQYYWATVRDISDRKHAEEKIRQLNRLYAALSHINEALVRIRDRALLFQECCRIAVEHGKFHMAWVGLLDESSGGVKVAANSAGSEDFLKEVLATVDHSAEARSAIGTAVREQKLTVCNGIASNPEMTEWCDHTARMGFHSFAAIPLQVHDNVIGTFNIYAAETLFFDEEERQLFAQIGMDLSFALEAMDREEDRQRATARLLESESAYRTIFENTGSATVIVEQDSTISLANKGFEVLSGYSKEELEGKKLWTEFVVPEDLETMRAYHLARRQDPMLAPAHYEFRFVARSRNVRIVHACVALIPGTSRSVASLLDITELEKIKESLTESEVRYRELVQSANSIILRLDTRGNIVFMNDFGLRFYGYREDELLGRNVVGALVPDTDSSGSDLGALIREILQQPDRYPTSEHESILRDRKRVRVSWANKGVYDKEGRLVGLLGIGNDVTQQRTLEEQYLQAQKMEAVGRLAGGLAHDFNNLLGVITGHSELALMNLQEEDTLRQSFEQIREASRRAAALTRQLLAFSRKQVLNPGVLNLNSVIAETEKLLRRLIGEDIELSTVLAADLGSVVVDPGQIEQVIMNLAVNARDAMPEGGRLILETANVELDESYAREHADVEAGRYVMLAVSDSGIGMDYTVRAHIFEPFFTTKEASKGTGLGLATVYGIIKQSNGHLWVYSEPGQGTTFKIYLPRVDAAPAERGADIPSGLPLQGTETVLLVEDEEALRNITRKALLRFGYTVLDAPNGETALEVAAQYAGPIHVLVTDVVMPGMTGRRLAEQLVALRPGIRVLFTSGYTDDAIVRHGVLEPGTAFLQKPFTQEELSHKLRQVLDVSG